MGFYFKGDFLHQFNIPEYSALQFRFANDNYAAHCS